MSREVTEITIAEDGTETHEYEVRPWERGTFAVFERRTRGYPWEDTWLTLSEAQARCDKYTQRSRGGL